MVTANGCSDVSLWPSTRFAEKSADRPFLKILNVTQIELFGNNPLRESDLWWSRAILPRFTAARKMIATVQRRGLITTATA